MKKLLASILAVGVLAAIPADTFRVFSAPDELKPSGWNESKRKNPDGSFYVEYKTSFQNYMEEDGTWKKSELAFKNAITHFSLTKAPYEARLPLIANQTMTFSVTNRYSVLEGKRRDDAPLSFDRTFSDIAPVPGTITPEGLLYQDAFPSIDASLLVKPLPNGLQWLIKWDARPTPCVGVLGGTVSVAFAETFDSGAAIKNDGRNFTSSEKSIGKFSVMKGDEFRKIFANDPMIWDSGFKKEKVEMVGKISNGILFRKKVIPCRFFSGATYPVLSDDSSSFFPNLDIVWECQDNNVWSDARDDCSEAGTLATDTASATKSVYHVNIASSGTVTVRMARGGFCFATATLPDSASISAATATFKGGAKSTDFHTDSVAIDLFTPTDPTSLVAGDYNLSGHWAGVQQATAITFADFAVSGGSNEYALSATGRGNIDKTTYTCFGLRALSDLNNSQPGTDGDAELSIKALPTSGDSDDPTLAVTYTIASTSKPVIIILRDFLLPYAFAH